MDSMEWHIGKVEIPNPFVLAPMAGVTDLPFRTLCKEQGAGLLCMEMVSAKAISFHNRNTEELMKTAEEEKPVSMQLFGSEPELMGDVAAMISGRAFDILDLNMGCPVPKIVNNGEGSALLKDPVLAAEIVRHVTEKAGKPVTVKMRIGFEKAEVDPVAFAVRMEEAGAAAIAVHGRTREQYYSGKADWETIRRVKEAVSVPVIGNGDIDSAQKAEEMFEKTKCDAVMIGRGARGNPWIFRECLAWFKNGERIPKPEPEEIRDMICRHAALVVKEKGEYTGIREMRKHIAWYTAGMPHSAALRRKANQISTMEELYGLFRQQDTGFQYHS